MENKKIVFLFGSGASVPAKCKTTFDISNSLESELKKSLPLSNDFPWILPLWELLKSFSQDFNEHDKIQFSSGETRSLKRFNPNFEQLIYLIELLDICMNNGITLPSDLENNPKAQLIAQKILEKFGARSDLLYPSLFYILTNLQPLVRDPILQVHNPPFQLWGTLDFTLAKNALIQFICSQFPHKYDLEFLNPFRGIFKNKNLNIVIATTNYDLVFENFFSNHSISYQDGFSGDSDLCIWKGFDNKKDVLYLKLHGSLDWYQIIEDWFKEAPKSKSINDIYKIPSLGTIDLLKDDLQEKATSEKIFRYEFNTPHLIMGGSKDRKISDSPFVELYRQWQNSLTDANTVVIVGLGVSDIHLLNQMKALLLNNEFLEKIIVINPDQQVQKTFINVFALLRRKIDQTFILNILTDWDLDSIETLTKLSFIELLLKTSRELKEYFECLKGTASSNDN